MKAFPAADGVFVSPEYRLVAVHLKDGQDIADAALRKAITDAGYTLVAIHRTDAVLADIKSRVANQKAPPEEKHVHDHDGMGMDMHGGKHD